MKKIKKILLITFISFSFSSKAQEFKYGEKSISAVFEINGKSKSELYSIINKWITINYNSAKAVTQLLDSEGGNIIVKGINDVNYKNTSRELFPKMKLPEYNQMKFNHLIEINIKDNKYRIEYKINDIATADSAGMNNLAFNCISFISINDTAINDYNNLLDNALKQGLIGKEKRENYKSFTKPMFQEISNNLMMDIKSTMDSILKSISVDNDKW